MRISDWSSDVCSSDLFKGKTLKIMSAPGAGNMAMARAVLGAVGMKEGTDYTLTELAMNLHVDAMKAGTFDAGYTLEPHGTVMNKTGAAHTVTAAAVSKNLLGREHTHPIMTACPMPRPFAP